MKDKDNGLPVVTVGRKWLRTARPRIEWESSHLTLKRTGSFLFRVLPRQYSPSESQTKKPTVPKVSYQRLRRLIRQKGCQLFALRLRSSVSVEFHPELATIVDELHDVFQKELPSHLPQQLEHDFEINLKQD